MLIKISRIITVFLFCLVCLWSFEASAHRINAFSYLEDGNIVTSVFFTDGSKCVKCPIEIVDKAEGKTLVKAQTDENGEYKYLTTEKKAYKIIIQTTLGHRAETEIGIEEFDNSNSVQKTNEQASNTNNEKPTNTSKPNIDEDSLRKLVRAEVKKELQILTKKEAESEGVSSKDILSGLAFIMGLFALVLHFSRKR